MIFNYDSLKRLPDDIHIVILLKFLGELKNARLRPGRTDKYDELPPVLFWWFEKHDEDAYQLIKRAIDNYDWKDKWLFEKKENNKYLLYPAKIREIQDRINKSVDESAVVTKDGAVWLMINEPEFGRRTNQDLDNFRKYFRKVIEEYLIKKEGKK